MNLPADDLPEKESPGLNFLEGITVVDFTTSVAGPYAGQLLGDLGATVIKIERPGQGDDCRAWGPPFLDGESLWYLAVNRNKYSVALDFSRPEGYEVMLKLIRNADVVLVNLVERVQHKLKLDYAALKAHNPALIHASITGFGLGGARSNMPCYDLIAEGYSGVMDMTGEPENVPQKIGTPAADLLAGADAALSCVAALFRKIRKGEGCQIDVSLVESMTRFMSPRLMPYLGSGEKMSRSGARDSVIAIYQVFETADEPITLGLGNDAIWRRFWHVLGEPGMAERPEYSSNTLRREQRVELVDKIAIEMKKKGRDEWLALFADQRVPAGPVYSLDEIAKDIDLRRRGFLYQFERNGLKVPQVGLGIGFNGISESCRKPPPRLGEDTLSILKQHADQSDHDLQWLAANGII